MSVTPLNWQAAQALAKELTSSWDKPNQPGGAITLFDATQLRGEVYAGQASLATHTAFDLDSVTRYASITKHIFAAMLVQHGGELISLEDKLGSHLPFLQGELADISVGEALDMSSGLPDVRDTLALLGVQVTAVSDAKSVLDFLAKLKKLNYPAGSETSYTNTGYRLVEAALQAKKGAFAELIEQHINQPLGINFQAPEQWTDVVPGLAPGYWPSAQGWQLAYAGLHLSASGCVTGSLRDLSRWLQSLLANQGSSAGLLEKLSATRYLRDGRPTQYGLGIAKRSLGEHQLVGHGGSHAGYKSYFLLHPQLQVGVALVANREDVDAQSVVVKVMAALLNHQLAPAQQLIPNGFYITAADPYWLEINNSTLCYLGSSDTLYQQDQEVFCPSGHMPANLRWDGSSITAEIGHVSRRYFPALSKGDNCLKQVQGTWRHPDFDSEFTISGNKLTWGAGPTALQGTLGSLGQGRMLVTVSDGPWTRRFCLYFRGYAVDIIATRSRVLTFNRKG